MAAQSADSQADRNSLASDRDAVQSSRLLKARDDLTERGPGTFLERDRRRSDIDESRDALAGLQAETFLDGGVISRPFRDPVGDETQRMRGEYEILARRSGRENLLPFRNRNSLAHAADNADHDGCAQESTAFRFDALWRSLGFGLQKALYQQFAHAVSAVALEHDEAPGKQLAVVGGARRDGQNLLELKHGRAGLCHGLCRPRTARKQQVESRKSGSVKNRGCSFHQGPMPESGVVGSILGTM